MTYYDYNLRISFDNQHSAVSILIKAFFVCIRVIYRFQSVRYRVIQVRSTNEATESACHSDFNASKVLILRNLICSRTCRYLRLKLQIHKYDLLPIGNTIIIFFINHSWLRQKPSLWSTEVLALSSFFTSFSSILNCFFTIHAVLCKSQRILFFSLILILYVIV